jgi:fibronectin-binding autotransporter adhesin
MARQKGGGSKKNLRKNYRPALFLAAAAISAGLSDRAHGQTTALWLGAGDGTSWNNPANWSTYPPSGDNLYFGAGPVGTINLQGNQIANSIDFLVGFTLDPPSSTDTLMINTGTVSVGASISAAINANILTPLPFTFTGPGTLSISGANSFDGGVNVTGGTLIVNGPSSLSTGTVSVGSGAEIMVATSTQLSGNITNNGAFDIPSGQTLTMSNNGGSVSFTQNAGTLTIAGMLNMTDVGYFFDNGGTITGTVNFSGTSGSVLSLGPGAGDSGTFIFTSNEATLEGSSPPTIPSGMTVTMQPIAGGELGSVANTINNSGNLNIIGSATSTATIGSGTLINTGIFTMSATGSLSTVADVILGSVDNTTGTVNINTSTQVSGSITNNGAFDIPSGQTLTMSNNGGSVSFTQNAGTLTIAGTLNMTDVGYFFDNGGTITGTVNFSGTSGSVLSLGPGAGDSGTFIFTSNEATLEGSSPPTIPSGMTITLQPTAGGELGSISTTVNNGGNLNIIGSATSTATMDVSTLTNSGILTMSATGSPSSVADFIVGNVENTIGTVDIDTSTQLSGNITNNSAFDIPSGQTLTMSNNGGSVSFTQNAGTLTIAGTLNMTDVGYFFDNGGTITGTVNFSGANGSVLSLGAGAGNSGTFILSGNGGTLEGGSPATIPSGVTVTLEPTGTGGQLNAVSENIDNAGNLNIVGSATSTATMNLGGTASTLTNTGILTMSATGAPSSVADFILGTLNNTTGTVSINASTQVSGSITNNGTFDIETGQTLSFSSSADAFTLNAGTLTIAGILNMSLSAFNDDGGTISWYGQHGR